MTTQQAEQAVSDPSHKFNAESLMGDFLTQNEAAVALRICEKTLERWRSLGEGPPVTKLGRRVLYRRSSLLAWLYRREQQSGVS